jgi:ATP-dependent Clp protease ATP-binding subunit ClpA
MTSNLGAKEIQNLAEGGLGFTSDPHSHLTNAAVSNAAFAAAKRHFAPEFINRLDQMIVFNNLTREMMAHVLDLEIQAVRERLMDSGVVCKIHVDTTAKEFLLEKGFDPRYNARYLKRAIEKYLVDPIISVMPHFYPTNTTIRVSEEGGELVFDSYDRH